MEIIKRQENQNILDIALQEYGTIEKVFDLIEANNLDNLTEDISVYEDIHLPRVPVRQDITSFYKASGIYPATMYTPEELKLLET